MNRSIAHVVFSLGVGGQERVILDLARAQRDAGHEVRVYVLSEPSTQDMGPKFAEARIPVVRVPKGPGVSPRMVWRLRERFRADGIDIVHTHNPMPLIYGAPAGKASGCAVVHTKHGEHRDTRLRMALRQGAGRCVDKFIAVSEKTAAFARQHHECAPSKLMVIRNGRDLSSFTGHERVARTDFPAPIKNGDLVAVTVGRFVPEKDHALLVRAMQHIPRAHLVLVGDGSLRRDVERQVASANLGDRVHFLGQRDDIPAVLAACDVYVISSRTEGLPISLIEAMACGLPVVSTRVGGIPSVLGDAGILVEPGDDQALADALRELFGNPERRRALGTAAQEIARQEFGAARMHKDYEAVYREITGDRS